jgi:alanyl-tRNA synthetase
MITIEQMKKRLNRGGYVLLNTMRDAIEEGILTGDRALQLFNTYGISIDTIMVVANSHGVEVEIEELQALIEMEREMMLHCRPAKLESD